MEFAVGAFPEAGVDRVKQARAGWLKGEAGAGGLVEIENGVLPVPGGDGVIGPDGGADDVVGRVAVFGEQGGPIALPAFVAMADAALAGDGGAEEDCGRRGDQIGNEALGAFGRKVLGDFELDGQIDAGAGEAPFEIVRGEIDAGVVEHVGGDPVPFDAKGRLTAALEGRSEPGAGAAADIGNATTRQLRRQGRQQPAGRVGGVGAAIFVEPMWVERSGHDGAEAWKG